MNKLISNKKMFKKQLEIKGLFIVLFLLLGFFVLVSCGDTEEKTDSKLSIPGNVKIEGSIISWDVVLNSTNYSVHIENFEGSPISTRELSYDLSSLNLTRGVNYSIRIQTIGNVVEFQHSDLSQPVSFKMAELPILDKPTELVKIETGFSWKEVAGAESYLVTIDGVVGSPFSSKTNSLKISNSLFVRGTEYKIVVKAKANSATHRDSLESNELSFTRAELPKLSVPDNISKSTTGFTWDIVSNAEIYLVTIEGINGSPFEVHDNSLVIDDKLFIRDVEYSIFVQAIGDDETYDNSELSISFKYTRPVLPKIATPLNFKKESWVISWDEVSNAVGYLVYIDGLTGSPFTTDDLYYDLSIHNFSSGTHKVSVVTVGDDIEYDNSEATTKLVFEILAKLPTPVNAIGSVTVLANGNHHVGIGPYNEGTQSDYAGKIGILIKNEITGEVYKYEEIAATWGSGSAYEFTGLPVGKYNITFRAIGNKTTKDDSNYFEPVSTFTITGSLKKPVLSIDEAILTWTEVDYASDYELYINEVLQENATSPFALSIEPGVYNIKLIAKSDNPIYEKSEVVIVHTVVDDSATPLDAPVVQRNGNLVSWEPVENATSYKLFIGGIEHLVSTNEFRLDLITDLISGLIYEITVIALGDGITYGNSALSNKVNYTAPLPKLGTPIHGINVDPITLHIAIGPYNLGNEEDFGGKIGILITDTVTLLEDYFEINIGFNTGIGHHFTDRNLSIGNYTITYRVIGNGTTHSNSNFFPSPINFEIKPRNLDKSVLKINKVILTWSEVTNAISYDLYINGELIVDAISPYDLSALTEVGTYQIKVVANGSKNYVNSEAIIEYVVESKQKDKLDTPINLVIDDGVLTFDTVTNATSYNIFVGDELKATITSNTYELINLGLDEGTYNISVQAVGDKALYLPSDNSQSLKYVAEQALIKLNPLTRADFAGTPEKGHGGGHYNFVCHTGHLVYNQDGFSGKIRFELVIDGEVIKSIEAEKGEIWMNKPTPEEWLLSPITTAGIYEVRVTLLASIGSSYANSDYLVLNINWPSA